MGDRVVDVVDVHAERNRLGLVNVELELGRVGRQVAAQARKLGAVLKGVEEVFGDVLQHERIVVAVREDIAREAVRGAKALDGRRQRSHALDVGVGGDVLLEVLLDLLGGLLAVVPVLELQDEGRCVAADVAAHRVVAHHRHDALHGVVLLEVLEDFGRDGLGAGEGRAFGELDRDAHDALVLARNEGGWRVLEHLPAAGRHGDEQACGDHAVAQRRLDELEEPEREGRESAVEGLEEPVLALFGLPFLEKDRAERRRERQGDEAREHDGQGDRHGKLAVELACDAAEEGDGDEDGGEHEHDGDECARDLLHGLLGRLVGAEALGAHETLDVLKHDDGIVDHDADRERHREERQRVEREAEEPEARHRADERHGHCEHRDERGAPVLQEDEDDEEHEDACLEQRVVDLVEGGAHEDRRVVGDDVVDLVFGELGGELDDAGLDGLGGRHGVGARLQVDADVDALRAVDVDAELVGALADFGRGDVLHAHELVGTVSLDDDVGELLGGEELTGRRDRVVELLLGHCGRRAHAARASLRVLGLDGVFDVLDRDAHEAHLFGIEPDAHGGLRVAEDAHVADAGQALEFVDDVEVRVVGQIGGGHAAVGREERDHEEVFLGALSHAHALIAHDVWQSAFGRADAVVDFEHGVVGVGADVKDAGNRHVAVASDVRRVVEQACDARELVLDWSGHGAGERLGVGAVVGGRDAHRRRRDVRILGERKNAQRDEAREHDDDREDRREDRAADAELAEHGAGSYLAVLEASAGCTAEPSRSLRSWLVITRSPVARPEVAIQSGTSQRSSLTGRSLALPSWYTKTV